MNNLIEKISNIDFAEWQKWAKLNAALQQKKNAFMVATGDDPEKDSNDTKPLKKDADYYVCDTCGVSTFGSNKRTAAELKKSSIDKFGVALCPKCGQAKLDEVMKEELAKIEAEQAAESAENAESEAKNGKVDG